MRFNIALAGEPAEFKTDLLIIAVGEDTKKFAGAAAVLDKASGGLLTELLVQERFEAKEGRTAVSRTGGKLAAAKVMLLGAGKKPLTVAAMRRLAALAAQKACGQKAKKAALLLPEKPAGDLREFGSAAAEGALLGDYHFLKYKGEDLKKREADALEELVLLAADKRQLDLLEKGAAAGRLAARGTILARDLVNEPASVTTPAHLMEAAKAIAAASKRISLKVYDAEGLKELGAGGILAVARGSDEPPYLIHLTYKPAKKARKRVAVVGKGLTFDSGGLSLKPSESMEDMKIDMAGAAAVLGLFSVLAEAQPAVEVHGIAGLCENMPSGKAVRPGDVVRTMSGKTVEILNTDAEGRVTLADTLHYAVQLRPDLVVDLATLTGACMVALGQEVAGLMGNSKPLIDRLLKAAAGSGEMLWQLPLAAEYRESIKSRVADLKNISGSRYGGAITAGLFLEEFVGKTPWAHLDIAGPAWAEKEAVPHQPPGATGFGVRTMLRLIQSY